MASRIKPVQFFRAYQAGFTIAESGPIINVCDCTKVDGKSVRGCSIFQNLGKSSCSVNEECHAYSYGGSRSCHKSILFNETICSIEHTCYTVDSFAVGILQVSCFY